MVGDEASTAAAGRPLGTISTLVSLFLLLLVFFIVLFSISQVHRPRLDAVVMSIDDAFGGIPSKLGLLTRPLPPEDADSDAPEGFVRAVTNLIVGFAPLVENRHQAPNGMLLEVDLAPEQLFGTKSSRLQPQVMAILDRLAVLLQRHVAGQHYRLTLRLVIQENEAATALAMDRAAGLAAALYAKGCPADALAIGVQHGDAATLRLDFGLVGVPAEAD